MHRVVEEAADAGAAHPGRFRFEVEDLADEAGFPQQAAVAASNSPSMPSEKALVDAMS